MALRIDRLGTRALTKATRTPQGGLMAPAYLTRVGVLTYTYGDGRVVRELRPPEEVFHPDSLASLAGAPLMVDHAVAEVTPENWRKHAVGAVADDVRQDGSFVAAKVRILDGTAIKDVESGTLCELSCGYVADMDPTPGVWQGPNGPEAYDEIQRNIRYNHVAMGPAGWGRAGSDVALKLDSKDLAYSDGMKLDSATATVPTVAPTPPAPPAVQAPAPAVQVVNVADYERLRGEHDALKVQFEALKASTSPAALDSLVSQRLAVRASASRVLGSAYKADGKTDAEIRLDVVKAAYPTLKLDSASADYVTGLFTAACEAAAKADASQAQTRTDAAQTIAAAGTGEGDPLEAARKRNAESGANAWKGQSK